MPPTLRPRLRRQRPPLDINLTSADYVAIMNYYQVDTTGLTPKVIKEKAETLLGKKLCKCIKKIQASRHSPADESRAIAICRDSVLTRKGLRNYNFKCKRTYKLLPQKHTRKKLLVYKRQRGPLQL
jgi:hypothetical protein